MFFTTSRKLKKIIRDAPKQDLEHFYLYNLKLNDIAVNLYVSRKRATKRSHIHCTEGGDIMWEQFYPFGGMSRPAREKTYVLKPICDKNAISIVVVRGKPGIVVGLDSLIKSSYSPLNSGKIFLLTEDSATVFIQSICQ